MKGLCSQAIALIFLCASPCLLVNSQAQSPAKYVGWQKCATCHSEITESWKKTRHGNAFNDLKKSKQDGLPDCQRCHVIDYAGQGGFIDSDLTPELADVQCEECHGSGAKHVEDPTAKGSIVARPDEQKCRKCHTEKQDPHFDYAGKSKLVHPVAGNAK